MKVTWRLDSHYHIEPMTGELDLDESMCHQEVEDAVREDIWCYLDSTWECEEMELTDQDVADRMSNALNAVGEASVALVFAEREACAKEIEAMIRPGINASATIALTAAVKRIRNRPR